QSVCLTELRERKRVPLAEQSYDAGCPYWIEAALARLHTGVGQEGAHVLRGNQEIEALDFRITADGNERHDADDGAVVIDRRPPAVSVDGGSIRLDHVLADGVRVESRYLSLRGGCFLQGAPAEELVIPDHSPEPEDVELVAELGLLICDRQSWIYAVLDFQQGQIAPGILERIALRIERDRRAKLRDLGLEICAVREQHAHPPRRRETDRGHGNRAQELFLEVRALTACKPARLQRRVHTAFLARPELQIERDPGRHSVCWIDDVGVGDEVAPAVHEPSGADLDERPRTDRDGTLATIHRYARLHLGTHERNSWYGEEQRLLDGEGER